MTNFKEQDGMLFKMLDKPVPLTPDAEMPCLVRLIQDDSPMGLLNKDLYAYDAKELTPKICTEVIDVNDLSDHNRGSVRYDGFISCQHYHYELIGTPVAEGSKDWALYQMMQGKCVCHVKAPSIKYHRPTHYIKRVVRENCTDDMSDAVWMEGADPTGWQIYVEPEQHKTMPVNEFADLFDAPIGWICKTRDGGSFPLKYIEVSPTRYAYEDKSGLTVYVMANGRYKKNGTDGRDIISCEHEQPEPKQDKTHPAINGYNRYDYIPVDGIKMPKPEPQYKVGDWVECNGNQCLIEVIGRDLGRGNYYHFAHGFGGAYANSITRKISPSEVIVKIGCLSGTVEDLSYEENGRFWLIGKATERHPSGMYSILYEEMLDAQTRELVEGLLKAQMEEE